MKHWVAFIALVCCAQVPLGLFENHGDIGAVLHPGAGEYDAATRAYTVTGSGENLWGTADALHFVWKKVSGDVTLSAAIWFPDTKGDPHKKAVLMMRQSLDPDSAYADVAVHGNGLTSLQSREEKGIATHEIQSNVSAPKRVALEKHGRDFYMFVAGEGEQLHMAGGSMRVPLQEPFYVGIGVCAHNKDAVEKAAFSDVQVSETLKKKPESYSTLETVTVASTDRRVTYVSRDRIESPVWSADGKSLIFRRNAKLWRIPVEGGEPEAADQAPIGTSQADATQGVQLPSDDFNNHFPHISPDGRRIAILSYEKGIAGRPADKDVQLRVMSVQDKQMRVIGKFVGGQGTMDLPSWSPDSRRLAFVSYQLIQ